MKKNVEFKSWHGVLLLAILFVAIVLGIVQMVNQDVTSPDASFQRRGEQVEQLTQASCESAGGQWEACGSACRGEEAENPEVVCIELCQEYCYCREDHQCPVDHNCVEKIEEIGICEVEF